MNIVEMNAADSLLNRRLKINIPAPWLLRKLGLPQNLLRMASLFSRMDIDLKELKAGELGTLLECVGRNTVTMSRIIAHGMIRGNISAFLFNRPLAFYLRSYMDMRGMAELTKIIVLICGGEDFVPIITSVSSLRLTEPTESQTTESGS